MVYCIVSSVILSCVKYVPEPEDGVLLHTALEIYQQFDQYPHALRLALMLNDGPLIRQLFLGCPDRSEVTGYLAAINFFMLIE